MIVSHSNKFIFVHIQKTAGTSITRYLDQYLSYKDLVLGSTEFGEKIQPLYKKRFDLHKHSYARNIKKITGDETWNDYFTFSLVRNPWDRMVSLYNWCRKGKFDYPICQEAIQADNYSQFIRGECFKSQPQQLEYLINQENEMIVDFVGKQESIQEDFDYICQKLKLPTVDMKSFKHNVRKRTFDSYKKYYDSDEDIEIIRKQFAEDIDCFNYQF